MDYYCVKDTHGQLDIRTLRQDHRASTKAAEDLSDLPWYMLRQHYGRVCVEVAVTEIQGVDQSWRTEL